MSDIIIMPNEYKALRFMQQKFPFGPWCITAIPPEGGRTTTRTFSPVQEEDFLLFLLQHNEEQNLYYHSNPVKGKLLRKASRSEIPWVMRLHVDIDPRPEHDLKTEQSRILKKLLNPSVKIPKPSTVIFSGGGYQALWDLKDWVVINNQNDIDQVELRNISLAQYYGGDSCHDISRLLRLPGTLNIPNKKKQEKGRTPCMAEVVFDSDVTYNLADFPKAKRNERGKIVRTSVKQVICSRPIKNCDLQDLPISNRAKKIIVLGTYPDCPEKYPSRSEAQWSASCEMARAGVPDPVHKSILLDPRLGVSKCVLDEPNPEQYADRQIQGAHDAKRK